MAAPAVRIARFNRNVVIFYITLRFPVQGGELTSIVGMRCPLDANRFLESRARLEEVLASGNPAPLEACTDLLVGPGSGDTVVLQCGSFNIFGEPYELTSGLKTQVPRAAWQHALSVAKQLLSEAPEPLV